jgi:hypothetical protein
MNSDRRHWLTAACALACGGALRPAGATTLAVEPSPATPAATATSGHPWLPQSRRIGSSTLRVLGMSVYDAELFALAGFEATAFAAHPLVLELRYRRSLTGNDIAEFSLKEMRRLAGAPGLDETRAERWLQFMRRAFPDVRAGDRLTGQWRPAAGATRFAANDGAAQELADAEFGPRFFGIWLARETSRPQLREQLLGLKAPS